MGILERSDVGLGVVYEQFMLNRLLERTVKRFCIKNAVEAPIFGMAGLTGINSMALPGLGVEVTLVDSDRGRLEDAETAWSMAGKKARFVLSETPEPLPFADSEFGLAYNFAALWHLEDPGRMVREMARVSSDAVLICMPNPWNPLFQLRKLAGRLPANHGWADMKRVEAALSDAGFPRVEAGVLDIPPWPDTVVALKDILPGSKKEKTWRWSMLDYYCGKAPLLKENVLGYSFIEDSPLPPGIKSFWAHHFYIIGREKNAAFTGR